MASFTDVSTPQRVGDQFALEVAPGWGMGRGSFGGLVIGSLIHAIELQVADPARRVRTVTAEIPGAVTAGPATIAVAELRRGNSVAVARAELAQQGEIRAHAVAVLAADRHLDGAPVAWRDLEPPEIPPWRSLEPTPFAAGRFPEFTQHFEYRFVEGVPHAGGAARTLGWIRPRVPVADGGAAYIAALADAWWPAALVRFPAMRPLATIAFTLEIVGDLAGLDPDAPLLYRAVVPVCRDGYFLETRELWGEDGRLVAINHQTLAIIA